MKLFIEIVWFVILVCVGCGGSGAAAAVVDPRRRLLTPRVRHPDRGG